MKRIRLDTPHGRSATEVLAALDVSFASGLSEQEAEQRLAVCGKNTIGSRQKVALISVLVHQLKSLVVALLAVAAAVAFYFREWEEGGAIVGVLILNTAIGFVTEFKAVRSIEAIRAMGSRSARVLRGGQTRPIPAERLVPGDIVLLDAGDVISADLRIVDAADLDADESTLTGESMRVAKSTDPVKTEARVADRTSMLFKGTRFTFRATCMAHARPDRAHRWDWTAARQGRFPDGRSRHCARRRGDPGGSTDRRYARAGARDVADGA